MITRNTKQGNLILEIVKNNRVHPTIYEIYNLVQKKDQTIGQATVYRNVKKFVQEGKLYVVKTNQGVDRYDYYNEHIHFECKNCGKLIDIMDDSFFSQMKKHFASRKNKITDYNLILEGFCENCQKE